MIRAELINAKKSASITLVKDLDAIDYSAKGLEADPESLTKLLTLFINWANKIETIQTE
jgi:hypothetical protein